MKLAESLSPITKKIDEVKETTQILGEIIEKSQPENNIPQPAIEHAPHHQPIENNEGVIYDVDLYKENTLNNMKINTGFFNIEQRDKGDTFWNGFPVEKIGCNELKINENIYDIAPGSQEVLTDTSNIPMKKLYNKDREIFKNNLESLDFENYTAIRGESKSGRNKLSETIFKKRNLEGEGIEKITIPSNIIDIYTRLEILLGIKKSGHTNSLSETSN